MWYLQFGNDSLKSKLDAILIVLPFVGHMAGVSLSVSLAGFEDPALCPFLLRGHCSLLSLSARRRGEHGSPSPKKAADWPQGLDKHRAGLPPLLDHLEVSGN